MIEFVLQLQAKPDKYDNTMEWLVTCQQRALKEEGCLEYKILTIDTIENTVFLYEK